MKVLKRFPASPAVVESGLGKAQAPGSLQFTRLASLPGRCRGAFQVLLVLITMAASPAGSTAQTPDTETEALMKRRAELLQRWKSFNLEENALFGGKSKKDLRNVVQTQKEIIELDNRILNAGKMSAFKAEKTERQETIQHRKSLYGRIDS
ncbi:MAG TPA: hypothetical protein VD772_08470, partial [Anseongella sp.]|nr:hypothetical protein [Anseongella sp.]